MGVHDCYILFGNRESTVVSLGIWRSNVGATCMAILEPVAFALAWAAWVKRSTYAEAKDNDLNTFKKQKQKFLRWSVVVWVWMLSSHLLFYGFHFFVSWTSYNPDPK